MTDTTTTDTTQSESTINAPRRRRHRFPVRAEDSMAAAEPEAEAKVERVTDFTYAVIIKDGGPTLFVAATVDGKVKVLQTRMSEARGIAQQVDELRAELAR